MEGWRDGKIAFYCDWCWRVFRDYRGVTAESRTGDEALDDEHFPGQMHACEEHRHLLLAGARPPTWPRSGATKHPVDFIPETETYVASDAVAADTTA